MSRQCIFGILWLLSISCTELYAQRTWQFQRVDANSDSNPDLQLTVTSAINLIANPIFDQESDAVDELIYAATDADNENGDAASHAQSIGEALCWTSLGNWDILGEVDLTADVDIYVDVGSGPTFVGVPAWNADIRGAADFVIEIDEEVDPEEELNLHGSFFALASGYTIDPAVTFQDNSSIGTTITIQLITPAESRTFTAQYNGDQWAWVVTDELNQTVDSGDGGGINELVMFDLSVLQGDLIQIRTSIIGGTAFPAITDSGRDKWAYSATAWFDVTTP